MRWKLDICILIIISSISFGSCFEENDITTIVDAICSWKGFVLDPYSCKHFLICDGPNQRKATRYSCPEKSRFDPKRNICVSATSILCKEMKSLCARYPIGTVVEYPLVEGVYGVCGTYYVLTCPKHHFRPSDQTALSEKCEFKCPGEGFYTEPLNGGEVYHSCILEGNNFVDHVRVCAKGTTFLPPNTFCTPVKTSSSQVTTSSLVSTEKSTTTTQLKLENKSSSEKTEDEVPRISTNVTRTTTFRTKSTTTGRNADENSDTWWGI